MSTLAPPVLPAFRPIDGAPRPPDDPPRPRRPIGIDRRPRTSRRARLAQSRAVPRNRVLAQLVQTPGLHLRALRRCVDLEMSTLENHLRVLQRQGDAGSRSFGHYKAYYPSAGLDRRDWDILFFLRQEQTGRILRLLATDPFADHTRLTAALGVTPPTCSFHLKKLQEAGLVDRERTGRIILWSLHDPTHVAALIARYPVEAAAPATDPTTDAASPV